MVGFDIGCHEAIITVMNIFHDLNYSDTTNWICQKSKPTTWQFNVMLTNKAKWFLKFDH